MVLIDTKLRTSDQPTIRITNTFGDDAVQRGIGNKFEPAPTEEPAKHIIIIAMLIAQLLRGAPGLQDIPILISPLLTFETRSRNDSSYV